jgi:drug/metabolite transporter (DMT)-like permease
MCSLSQHSKGALYAFAGILLLSPDTVLLRATDEVPPNEVLLWRNFLATITLIIFTFFDSWNGKASDSQSIIRLVLYKFSSMRKMGYLAATIYAGCNICFLFAVKITYAANVLVIISTSSIFAAIASYFLLGERLRPHTICACLVCFGAILYIFSDQVFQSNSDGQSRDDGFSRKDQVIGNVLAVLVAIGSGCYFTLLRHIIKNEGNIDLTPVNILSCGIVTVVSMCFANNGCTRMGPGEMSVMASGRREIVYLLLQGVVSIPVSYSLLTHASTLINSAEVGIIMTLETVLGPLWVWMGGFERPPTSTLYGGFIIIISLSLHEWYNLRTETEGKEANTKKIVDDDKNLAIEMSQIYTTSTVDGCQNHVSSPMQRGLGEIIEEKNAPTD